MTIHEKSAWVSIIAIVVLYVPYFMAVHTNPMESIARFWILGVGMAVIMGVFHTIDAIVSVLLHRGETMGIIDELDRVIQQQAAMYAGSTLAFIVVIWVIVMMYILPIMGRTVIEQTSDMNVPYIAWSIEQVMRAVQWLFAGFVLANIVYYAVVIVRYRSVLSGR